HGLCSYGLVLRAVIDDVLGGNVTRVHGYGVTFGGIFFPGETMRIRVWEEGSRLLVAATAVEREGAPVLKNVVVDLAWSLIRPGRTAHLHTPRCHAAGCARLRLRHPHRLRHPPQPASARAPARVRPPHPSDCAPPSGPAWCSAIRWVWRKW